MIYCIDNFIILAQMLHHDIHKSNEFTIRSSSVLYMKSWTSASDTKTVLFKPLNTVFHNKTVLCITTTGHMKHFKHSIQTAIMHSWIVLRNVASLKNTPEKRTLVLWCCNTEKLKVKSCQRDNIWNYCNKFLPFDFPLCIRMKGDVNLLYCQYTQKTELKCLTIFQCTNNCNSLFICQYMH